jgi:hypothetical protein
MQMSTARIELRYASAKRGWVFAATEEKGGPRTGDLASIHPVESTYHRFDLEHSHVYLSTRINTTIAGPLDLGLRYEKSTNRSFVSTIVRFATLVTSTKVPAIRHETIASLRK